MIFFTALVDQIMILLDNSLYSWLWFCLTQNLSWLEVGLSWSSGVGIQNWQKQSMQHFFKNWFWIYFFSNWPHLGPLLNFSVPLGMFFGLLGLFWGWVQVQKYIWNLLLLTINFVLELQLLVFVYNSTKFGAYLLFLMLPQLGPLLPFLSPSGPFFPFGAILGSVSD